VTGVRYLITIPATAPSSTIRWTSSTNTARTADGSRINLRAGPMRCEAARLAVTRPDIATQVADRKEPSSRATPRNCHAGARRQGARPDFLPRGQVAPSSSGLARFEYNHEVSIRLPVVEAAHHLLGANWMAISFARVATLAASTCAGLRMTPIFPLAEQRPDARCAAGDGVAWWHARRQLRVVLSTIPNYPGYVRVICNASLTERSDLGHPHARTASGPSTRAETACARFWLRTRSTCEPGAPGACTCTGT